MNTRPEPEIDERNHEFWTALEEGVLKYQRCLSCDNAWLPIRSECPRCLEANWTMIPSSGRGRLVSWVVYRTSYHPYFEDKLPYAVAVVELEEGPRLIASMVDEPSELRIDQPLILSVQRDDGRARAAFAVAPDTTR